MNLPPSTTPNSHLPRHCRQFSRADPRATSNVGGGFDSAKTSKVHDSSIVPNWMCGLCVCVCLLICLVGIDHLTPDTPENIGDISCREDGQELFEPVRPCY